MVKKNKVQPEGGAQAEAVRLSIFSVLSTVNQTVLSTVNQSGHSHVGEYHSLWWLLQPKHAHGRDDEHADRNLPQQPAVFLQPEWRQLAPEQGAVGAVSNVLRLIIGVFSSVRGLLGKKKTIADAEKEQEEEAADDEDEDDDMKDVETRDGVPEFPFGILNPKSVVMVYWQLTIVALAILNTAFVPFRFCFETQQIEHRKDSTLQGWGIWNSNKIYAEYLVDAFFALDIFVQLRSAYFTEYEGDFRIVVAQGEVMSHNLKKWFLLDVAVGLPYEFWFNRGYHLFGGERVETKNWVILVRFARILKILKLKELFTITRVGNLDYTISSIKEKIALSQGPMRVLKFGTVFLYALHFVSCLLFGVGIFFDDVLIDPCDPSVEGYTVCDPNLQPKASWIRNVVFITSITEIVDGEVREYSNAVSLRDPDIPISNQYLGAIYYMTTTLTGVGYGDVLPTSFYEVILLSVAMVVGAGIFSYIVGNAEQFIIDFQGIDVEMQEKMEEVIRLLFEANLPQSLRVRVIAYFQWKYSSPTRMLPYIIAGLPDHVSAVLKMRIYSKALYMEVLEHAGVSVALMPMLAPLCEPLLVRLIKALRVEDYNPGMMVIERGEESNGIRWIWNGTFEVLDISGNFIIASLSAGLMLGENCLVKDSPKNFCSVRAQTFGNTLVLSTSDFGNVFAGYDRDLHRMMSLAEVRWPRFCAAVALSNVLESASRVGDSLRSWIHEIAQADEGVVNDTLIRMKIEESESIKRASTSAPVKRPSLSKESNADQEVSDEHKEPEVRPPSASGILKKSDSRKKQSRRKVLMMAENFGNTLPDECEDLSGRSNMECGSTSLRKYCAPTVVHGANMGFGGAAGGRSPLDHKEYEVIVDEDEDDYGQDASGEDEDYEEDEEEDEEVEEEGADDKESNTHTGAENRLAGAGGLMAGSAYGRSAPRPALASSDANEEEEYEDDMDNPLKNPEPVLLQERGKKDLVEIVFEELARICDKDRDVMLSSINLCLLHEQEPHFDTSISWLDAPEVAIEAETIHIAACPQSKLTIQVASASGLSPQFGLLELPNAQVRISCCGTYYETLVAGKSRAPVWNETFTWTANQFKDDAEIHLIFLDVRDATHTVLLGTSDIQLSSTHGGSGSAEEWTEETFDIVDKHGEPAGSVVLKIMYCPVFAAGEGLQANMIEDFMNARYTEGKDQMLALLQQVCERLEMVEATANENREAVIVDLQNTCKTIIHGRKHLQRPCVSMAKQVLRETLGEDKANVFLAEAFGPDGDSDETDAESHQEVVELTEHEKRKLEVWKRFESSSGKPFWYNKYTKETTWRDPIAESCDDLQSQTVQVLEKAARTKSTLLLQDLPDGWVQRKSRTKGFVYFQDVFTGERMWQAPHRSSLFRNPLEQLGGLLTVDILEMQRTSTKKHKCIYTPIPTRVTSGTVSDLLAGQLLPGEVPKAKVTEYMQDMSRKEQLWRKKPEAAVPRRNEFLRCEIIFEEKDSRATYRGETRVNERNGLGVLTFKDGVVYHGQFSNDLPNGLAVETYPGGFVYKGGFVDDERHGLGIIQSPGLAYIGYWSNGKRHGLGVERFTLVGNSVESLARYDHGNLLSRERIDIENQEEVSALKIATGQTARKAALLAEKSRIISSAIRGLLEAEEKRKAAQLAAEEEARLLLEGDHSLDSKPDETVDESPALG